MKRFLFFLLSLFLLTSCASAVQTAVAQSLSTSTEVPVVVSRPAVQTAVAQSLSTSTEVPVIVSTPDSPTLIAPSPTAAQAMCDPFVEDFCITEGNFIFQAPIFPPDNTFVDISYRYGSTQENTREPHHGVEFLNKFGTPVHAARDGVVQFAGPDKEALYSPWKDFYGNVIVVGHANELYTLYGHLSEINVQVGDIVLAGDLIGEVGQSGVATGSHLHFEIRKGGDGTDYFSTQNPELWLIPNRNEKGDSLGVISFAIEDQNSRFRFAEFTARYFLDKNGPKIKSHYIVTYTKDMMRLEENAALGDLPPGYYYVVLKHNGQLYERWVEVESGKLTKVVFLVK